MNRGHEKGLCECVCVTQVISTKEKKRKEGPTISKIKRVCVCDPCALPQLDLTFPSNNTPPINLVSWKRGIMKATKKSGQMKRKRSGLREQSENENVARNWLWIWKHCRPFEKETWKDGCKIPQILEGMGKNSLRDLICSELNGKEFCRRNPLCSCWSFSGKGSVFASKRKEWK